MRSFLQKQLQAAEKDREQRQSEEIDSAETAPVGTINVDGPGNQQRDDDPRRQIDQEQPMPRKAVRNKAADGWSKGRRQHRQQTRNESCPATPEPLEHQKNGRENERDQKAPAEALQHPRRDQRPETVGHGAGQARTGKAANAGEKGTTRGHDAGQPAGQRDRDDLCYQICGLHPAQLIERNAETGLNIGQRTRDDLNVQDRHEHTNAHGGEPDPGLDLD